MNMTRRIEPFDLEQPARVSTRRVIEAHSEDLKSLPAFSIRLEHIFYGVYVEALLAVKREIFKGAREHDLVEVINKTFEPHAGYRVINDERLGITADESEKMYLHYLYLMYRRHVRREDIE